MNARIVLMAVVLAALPLAANAQEVNLGRLDDSAVNRVHVRTGAEYGFVAGVGYARAVPVLDRTVLLGADLTLPWASPDAGDWRVRASALVPIVGGDRWKLAGTLAPTLRETSNEAGRMTGLGLDLGLLGGWYAPGWFAGAEAGFDWEMATYISNSDRYRTHVFPDARDGWYSTPGGNLRLGVQAGLSFSRYDLVLRAGRLRDLNGNGPMLPFYGTLTLDTRF